MILKLLAEDNPQQGIGFNPWSNEPEPQAEGLNSENWGKTAEESLEKQLDRETKRLTKKS